MVGEMASADAIERVTETYIAKKNGVTIVLSGVRHGSGMPSPPPDVRTYFDQSSVLMTEFDFTDRRRLDAAADNFRHGGDLAANKFLVQDELEVMRSAWMKNLGGKAKMTATTLGELHVCGITLYLLPFTRGGAPLSTAAKTSSWEEIFLPEAKTKGKKIVELEPFGAMRVCEQLPHDQIRAFVLEAAKLGLDEKARERYLSSSALSGRSFDGGNGEAGYAQFMDALSSNEKYKSVFISYLELRNKAMADVIVQQHGTLLPGGYAFLLVGALHLHGETGILSLLRARGFHVTRN